MTDTSGARRKLRLFNLNVVRHLAAPGVTTTLEELTGGGDAGRRPLRRSHTLHLGAPLHTENSADSPPPIMRLLPRLRPRPDTQVQTTMGSGRRDSYTDDIIEDDLSSGSSPLATPLPAAYARYLKRATMPYTAPSGGGNGASVDPYRLRTLPRPEDRRSRVSRIYSDLNRKRTGDVSASGMALQTVQGVPLMTAASAAAAGRMTLATTRHKHGGLQSRGQHGRRQVEYDPRPQDVVEKCERWVASLPSTFSDVMGRDVISILDTDVTSESEDSDIDGLFGSGIS